MESKKSFRSFDVRRVLYALAMLGAVSSPTACATSKPAAAKVSMDAARTTALAKVPGRITKEELENEGGRLIYSFVIKPQGETRAIVKEVNVDAHSGALVDIEEEAE